MAEIKCKTFSEALALVLFARRLGMRASYWPRGGDRDAHTFIPVTHNVRVIGTRAQLKELPA